ncbi:MAG: DUF4136 domain-containing protein [Sphingobium sp.]
MRNKAVFIGLAVAWSSMSGCAVAVPPVEVTRFHIDAPATTGTIAIEEAPGSAALGGGSDGMEFRTYTAAVAQELQRIGFSEAATSKPSEYVAAVTIDRNIREPGMAQQRSPVSVGVGGSTGSYGSGIGLGIGINLSGKPKNVIATSLSVQIRRRSDNLTIWEGRARTEAKEGTPAAQPSLAAAKLASALFGGYPGQSGQTIKVK